MLVWLALVLAALAAPSTGARTPTDVEVVCSGRLPFSSAEMEAALRARRPLLGTISTVEVRREDDGRTLVRVGAAEREVDWGGRTGQEAARLAAVLVLDLARADVPITVSRRAPPADTPRVGRTLRLGLTLRSPFDQDGTVARLEPTLDLALDLAWGVAVFVAAGYRRVTAGLDPGALHMQELPVRAGVAYRRRWLELRLCGLARPYTVGGAGAHRGAIWGGGASAAVHWPVRSRLSVELAAGLDVLRARMVFSVEQQPVLATAWLAPWVGAGLAWETSL